MAPTSDVKLLIGTKKGGFTLSSDGKRNQWDQSDPIFLGHIIHHFVSDPRDASVCLMAAKTGHLGPTVFRSLDGGATWKFDEGQYLFGFREFIIPVASLFFYNWETMRSTGKFLGVTSEGKVENKPAGAFIEKKSRTSYENGKAPV